MKETFKVLLVEDEPADTLALTELLVAQPSNAPFLFDLDCAQDLGTGLRLLQERCYDAVLLDLTLPDSRGIETLGRVLGCRPGIPVVILTGLDDERLAAEAVRMGAQKYLVKGTPEAQYLKRDIFYAVETGRGAERTSAEPAFQDGRKASGRAAREWAD